jgi:hypothetical protein
MVANAIPHAVLSGEQEEWSSSIFPAAALNSAAADGIRRIVETSPTSTIGAST